MNDNLEYYEDIFNKIIDLKISENEIKDFLLELNEKNLPQNAFIGASKVLKAKMKSIDLPFPVIDVCGTGGDKLNTLNISTAVCFVLAGAGVKVAKHGNKAVSSNSGSADIFSELGIEFDDNEEKIKSNLEKNNLSFLFAPYFHAALKNIAGIRKSLGQPTIFNFLGPILNPTNTDTQLIGVSRKDVMPKMLETIKFFNPNAKIYMVHGFDGMDEATITNNSYLLKLENGEISQEEIINPENYGLKKVKLDEIAGQDPKYNAVKLLELLDGKKSPYQDIVCLNASLALKLTNKASSIEEGIKLAQEVIDKKLAKNILQHFSS